MSVKQTTRQEWEIIKKLDAKTKYGPLQKRLADALSTHDTKSLKKIMLDAKMLCEGWALQHVLVSAIKEAGIEDAEVLSMARECARDYLPPPKAGVDLGGVSITIQRSDDEDGPKLQIDTDSG